MWDERPENGRTKDDFIKSRERLSKVEIRFYEALKRIYGIEEDY